MADQRIPTGISGLDEVLHGGYIENQSYLLVGSPGTGKTVCSVQWLLDETPEDQSLFITLAEPFATIQRNMRSFGWDLSELDHVDLNPTETEAASQNLEEYNVFPPSEVERAPMWQNIQDAVEREAPDRVVIDSVTQLRHLSADEYQFRRQILRLVNFLRQQECTSLLTFESTELEREASVAHAVDGIIQLQMKVSPHRVTGIRNVQVQKLRGSGFMSGFHPMRISGDGIRIFPHHLEKPSDTRPGEVLLSSGDDNLDRLLGGGLESGTATILSGPTGVGKSTLGMQFLVEAAHEGQRAVFYTFEEAPRSITMRNQALGLSIEPLLESDMLRIVRVNPMELYPDEFLDMIRTAVEEEEREVVMVDSLRGYELAMEEFGSFVANIQNMVTYLNRKGVATILVNEIMKISGDLQATEFSISYVADTIVLLRRASYAGNIIKAIACLKKRHSSFDPSVRKLIISGEEGVHVAEELKELHGLLKGAPSTDLVA